MYLIKTHALLFLVSCLLLLSCCKSNQSQYLNDSKNTGKLLSDAEALIGESLYNSESKTRLALSLAEKNEDAGSVVDAQLLLGRIYTIKGNNDSALYLFTQALNLSNQNMIRKGACWANMEIGDVYYTWGNYPQAMAYFDIARRIAEIYRFKDCEAKVLSFIGKYYHTKGDLKTTFDLYEKSLKLSRELNNDKQIALVLSNLGKYYISIGKLNLALDSYLEAYKTCERFSDKIVYAEVCNHLGGLYLLIDQPDKSLEFHRKALVFRNIINNPEGIAKSYNNIGKIFMDKHEADSALYYFNQSFELCQSTGYRKGTVKALTNIGRIYGVKNKPDLEKQTLQKAFDLAKESGYDIGMAEAGMELGNYYMTLKNFDQAIGQYLFSLKLIRNSNLYDLLKVDYSGLYQCYYNQNNIRKALEYHIFLAEAEKDLLSVENNRQTAILQISFDSERKEKDNQVLRKDLEIKRMDIKRKTYLIWFIILALAASVLMCILLYSRSHHKHKANLLLEGLNRKIVKQNGELEKLNQELEKANHEKDVIFSIITHELRNPLFWFQNLVEMLSRKHKTMNPERVQKTLAALDESAKNSYHLMDNLLNWSRSRLNRITPKKANLHLGTLVTDTVKMHETILDFKGVILNVKISPDVCVFADPDLLSCVFRNLISNAIKFTSSGGTIEIGCMEDEKEVIVSVSDSGKGMDSGKLGRIFDVNEYFSSQGLLDEKGSGLGLKICAEFVNLNNGRIWVFSEPDKGTSFYFTIPKSSSFKNKEITNQVLNSGILKN